MTRRAGLSGGEAEIEKFTAANRGGMAADRDGAPVFLAKSAWELGYVAEKFPNVTFLKTRERHEVHAEKTDPLDQAACATASLARQPCRAASQAAIAS